MKSKPLTQEMLKMIACFTMLIDHVGAVYFPGIWQLRAIGRLAFPVFCYLLAEGIHYTRNPGRYALRLAIGAALSEMPFDLLFFGELTWSHQSVMLTLLMGFLYGMLQKRVNALGPKLLAMIPFIVLANLMNTDYSGWGVATVALFVLTRHSECRMIYQIIGMILLSWMIGGMEIRIGFVEFPVQILALAALVPIYLYSGQKSTKNIWVQRTFYLFYPVHMAVLLIARL